MMGKEMLTGNGAAAWGVRMAEVDYIPAYPITPQTEIIETIAKWISDGPWMRVLLPWTRSIPW